MRVYDDLEQAKRMHDERRALRDFVWIENSEGRAVDRERLDVLAPLS
ncbi:MAG: hypothetical protein ACM3ZV_08050 [Bacillota bacterium]